jgi:hypothetical protein
MTVSQGPERVAHPATLADLTESTQRHAIRLKVEAVALGYFDDATELLCHYVRHPSVQFGPSAPVRVSCVAKFVTSKLTLSAIAERKLAALDSVGELLASCGLARAVAGHFSDITIRQLLDHTHGLDGMDIGRAPLSADGYIDLEGFCSVLAGRPRLHAPGQLYSYSHAGYIIAGALLERIYRVPLVQLFSSQGHSLGAGPESACPATGDGFTLCVERSVRLLKEYWTPQLTRQLIADIRPLPGYNWTDTGFSWGWRCQKGGWLYWIGAPGDVVGDMLVLRINPRSRQGLCIAGRGPRVRALSDLISADLWDDTTTQPRRIGEASSEAASDDDSAYTGVYADATVSIEVSRAQRGLRMAVRQNSSERTESAAPAIKHLSRAAAGCYFCLPPDRGTFHFVQFLREGGSTHVTHLWDGIRIFQRR